eukprot:gene3536-13603_t
MAQIMGAFPGADDSMHNGGVRGITSTYMALCLDLHVPQEPLDIVLAEFAVNDIAHPSPSFAPGSRRAAYERLLRKLQKLPGHPVVIVINMFTVEREMKVGYWENAELDFQEFSTYYGLPTVSFVAATYHSYWENAERDFQEFSTYYGLPTVSFKAATYHSLKNATPGLWEDGPVPLAVAGSMPEPMIPSNYESSAAQCLMERKLQDHVKSSEGWNYTDEGRGPGKWGYVSTTVAAKLVIEIDTTTPPEREYKSSIWVSLAYLKSYNLMGTASVECISGCTCGSLFVDGAGKSRMVSLTYIAALKVSQHAKCQIQVTVLKKTATKGNKFKFAVALHDHEALKMRCAFLADFLAHFENMG